MPPLDLLHIDDHLVVVNKPARLLAVAAPGRKADNLVDRLGRQLGQRLHAVHRLDEDTTGAVCIARDPQAREAMEDLFRRRAVQRDYLALVAGRPNPPNGRIESRVREDGGVMKVVTRGGQTAVTNYETIQTRGRFTLVRCRLETGRRNQIRVHLQAIDCPLAGDRKYGFRPRGNERFHRPMLHSWRLRFRHPLLGTEVDVEVAPPEQELAP